MSRCMRIACQICWSVELDLRSLRGLICYGCYRWNEIERLYRFNKYLNLIIIINQAYCITGSDKSIHDIFDKFKTDSSIVDCE